jgi:tetratricopeptide (TPR) repeat protein
MDPASWSGLAGIYLERDDNDAALPQLIELARIEDGDFEVRAKIAWIYRQKGGMADSRYWLGRAVFIDPFNPKLHVSLAETLTQMGDHEAALREYTMLTKLVPGNVAYWEQAALTSKRLNREVDVRRFAEQAVKLKPDSIARNLLTDQPTGER